MSNFTLNGSLHVNSSFEELLLDSSLNVIMLCIVTMLMCFNNSLAVL